MQSTKRDLAAQIDNSSRKFDDIVTMDAATKDEVWLVTIILQW